MQNLRVAMTSFVTKYATRLSFPQSQLLTVIQVLWPCLHYAVPDAPKTKLFYESASFKQYMSVNKRFAEVIIANYREGDTS